MARLETDSIGTRELPEAALYGVNTLRAMENFDISPLKIGNEPAFIRALAYIKKAAAKANCEIGALEPALRDAIVTACNEVLEGRHHDQFVVDLLEGSGGTSINMDLLWLQEVEDPVLRSRTKGLTVQTPSITNSAAPDAGRSQTNGPGESLV